MKIIHRGHSLTQQQLDALVPVMNRYMHGEIKKRDFEAEVDKALEAAGCPVPHEIGPEVES
jgi:F0F1-type ATP synthase delta subunit